MIYLGTSGFSYNDWVGIFYPAKMPKNEWLTYYSHEFNTCEINSTYYAIPSQAVVTSMVNKTGLDFQFVVKANQEMTHNREDTSVFKSFCLALEPMVSSGKLGCVLAQFPFSFRPGPDSREYLEFFKAQMGDLPTVIEFRNAQWLKGDTLDRLRNLGLGFCCVDEPQLPGLMLPVAEATSKIGYIRFHGRNSAKWWEHEQAYERYDYTYSDDELNEWLPKIRKIEALTEKTFVFANNHWKGQAVKTIRQLKLLLD